MIGLQSIPLDPGWAFGLYHIAVEVCVAICKA